MTKTIYVTTVMLLVAICVSTGTRRFRHETEHLDTEKASAALYHFAIDTYHKITREITESNMLFSPISLYTVLTMLLSGLGGESRLQIENALHMGLMDHPLQEEHQLCQAVFLRNGASANNPYNLTEVNKIFIDKSFRLLKRYKAISSRRYHTAPVKRIDFKNHSGNALKKINRFVSKETNGQIDHLIPEGGVDENTVMVLVNTIHMEASWNAAFSQIEDTEFIVDSTENISAKTMRTIGIGRCRVTSKRPEETLNSRVVLIPFQGYELSMVIFMPTEAGNFSPFDRHDADKRIRDVLDELPRRPRQCRVTMPKFAIKYKINDLQSVLQSMGIEDIFQEGRGNFTRMTPDDEGLYVSDVQHEAAIRVSEMGVAASAGSSIGVGFRSRPQEILINQPFLFLIRHEATKAILFIGRVTRPRFEE